MAINQTQRFIRKTVILAKLESTYGTEPATWAGADALLVSNATLNYVSNNRNRDVTRPYLGASEELVGDDHMELAFECEMAPSGAKGLTSQWGLLLRGCGMSEVVTLSQRVEYAPISGNFESLAFHYVLDGVRYKVGGARGSVELVMNIGEAPRLRFNFMCRFDGVVQASAVTPDYTGWQLPEVVTNYNTADVKLGGTFTAGAVTGGNVFASRGFTFNLGNNTVYQPMLGVDRVLITDRASTGQVTLDLDVADEIQFRKDVRDNAPKPISIEHGSADGKKLLIWAPRAQFANPTIVDQDGVAMTQFDVRLLPTAAGNDEFRIVCK